MPSAADQPKSRLLIPSPLTLPSTRLHQVSHPAPHPHRSAVSPSDLLGPPRNMGKPRPLPKPPVKGADKNDEIPTPFHIDGEGDEIPNVGEQPLGPPSYQLSADTPLLDEDVATPTERTGDVFADATAEKKRLRQAEMIVPVPAPPSYDAHAVPQHEVARQRQPAKAESSRRQPPPQQITGSGTPLHGTDLCRVDYGAMFAPHAHSPITCMLTLPGDTILVGAPEGLRVILPHDEYRSRGVWSGCAVWDMVTLKRDEGRGSVLILCGGSEDGSTGRPKSGAEARVYKLENLLALVNHAARQDGHYDGPNVAKKDRGKGVGSMFGLKSAGKRPVPAGDEDALRLAREYTVLPAGESSDVTSIATHFTPGQMSIALATSCSIVLHQGRITPAGSYAFSPAKTFYIPFSPTSVSIVDLEIPGGVSDVISDAASSLFEWDDAGSESSLGEGVLGETMGLFVTFNGARGCVIRTGDSGVVELKKGGRGEWLPVQRVKLSAGDVDVFTRGTSSFLFPSPLIVPLALQIPITEVTWPELPRSIQATEGPTGGLRLLGLTSNGNLHIIDVNATTTKGIETDWSSVSGAFGDKPRFMRGDGEVHVGTLRGRKDWQDWRLVRLDTTASGRVQARAG